jgi:hypothetical protein
VNVLGWGAAIPRRRRTPKPPAAESVQQATPPGPVPPPGPLPRHDHGGIAWQMRRWTCGCTLTYDGDGAMVGARPCTQVNDLRRWDREFRT